PDSVALYTMFTDQEARDLLKLIEEAYGIIGNVSKREEYDRSLKGITTPSGSIVPTLGVVKKVEIPSIPKGFLSTKYGVYEEVQDLEEEIKGRTIFDGEFFRKVRQYKKLTIDNLSAETRISRTYIAAIEENNYPLLQRRFLCEGLSCNWR